MTAAVPEGLFGKDRGLDEIPGEVPEKEPTTEPSTEPSTEPTTEPSTEPTTEPTHEPSPYDGLNLWQRIVRWFRGFFQAFRDWFIN